MTERRLPPVTAIAITSMALIVTGGIWIASHLPHHVPLGPAVVLLVASALLIVVNVVSLTRVPDFNWGSFFLVAKWAGLAYAITAAILEWVFVKDGTSGGPARRADAVAGRLRGPRPAAHRVHRRALRPADLTLARSSTHAIERPWPAART